MRKTLLETHDIWSYKDLHTYHEDLDQILVIDYLKICELCKYKTIVTFKSCILTVFLTPSQNKDFCFAVISVHFIAITSGLFAIILKSGLHEMLTK